MDGDGDTGISRDDTVHDNGTSTMGARTITEVARSRGHDEEPTRMT